MSAEGSAVVQPGDVEGYIKGLAIAEMVLAIVMWIVGILSIEHGVHLWLTPVDPTHAPPSHSASYSIYHGLGWLYGGLLLIWLSSQGRGGLRTLRPVGICLCGWSALKLSVGSFFAVFLVAALGDTTLQYQGHAVRLGDAIGGLMYAFAAGFVFVTLCAVGLFFFYSSRAVEAALGRSDGARYWTDAVPMPLLFGAWMFVALAADLLGDLHELRLETWFGPLFGLAALAVEMPAIGLLVCLAWGFCRRRPWAWYLALAATPLWFFMHFSTSIRPDDPELSGLRDYSMGADIAALVNRLLPMMNALTCVQCLLFLGYLFAVRRMFQVPPPPSRVVGTRVMADPGMYWGMSKRLMGVLLLAGAMLMMRQYFLSVVMLLPLFLMYLYGLLALRVPALVFGSDAVCRPLAGLVIPPCYPYTRLKQVRVLTEWPKMTPIYEPAEQRLNLSAGSFTPADLQRLKAEFETHGVGVTVGPPG